MRIFFMKILIYEKIKMQKYIWFLMNIVQAMIFYSACNAIGNDFYEILIWSRIFLTTLKQTSFNKFLIRLS